MKYKFANISTTRAAIGDMREKIDIETVDMEPVNDFSGEYDDTIVPIAENVWAAVELNMRGAHKMLEINTDKQETVTHTFWCRYWDERFLEARFIKWKGNRYRVIRPDNMKQLVAANGQICFPCALKGDINKTANTWG